METPDKPIDKRPTLQEYCEILDEKNITVKAVQMIIARSILVYSKEELENGDTSNIAEKIITSLSKIKRHGFTPHRLAIIKAFRDFYDDARLNLEADGRSKKAGWKMDHYECRRAIATYQAIIEFFEKSGLSPKPQKKEGPAPFSKDSIFYRDAMAGNL